MRDRKKQAACQRAFLIRQASLGLCQTCKAKAVPGRRQCERHLAIRRMQMAEKRARRKKRGLCPYCGKNKPNKGYKLCQSCLVTYSWYNKKAHSKAHFYGNRAKVMDRDNCRCRICGAADRKLTVHHIDGQGHWVNGTSNPTPNDHLDNLIVLCRGCHGSLTKFLNRSLDIETVVCLLHRILPVF